MSRPDMFAIFIGSGCRANGGSLGQTGAVPSVALFREINEVLHHTTSREYISRRVKLDRLGLERKRTQAGLRLRLSRVYLTYYRENLAVVYAAKITILRSVPHR